MRPAATSVAIRQRWGGGRGGATRGRGPRGRVCGRVPAGGGPCRAVGRDPATLVRTAGGNIAMPGYLGKRPDPIRGSEEEIASAILRFRELGIQHFVAGLDPCTPQTIE